MFLQERYRRNPALRRASTVDPEPPTDDDADSTPEADAWDEADELAAMPDAEFLRQLRQEVDRVAAGEIPGTREKPRPITRPRRVRRDRYGNRL
jgi:hypothetical protein